MFAQAIQLRVSLEFTTNLLPSWSMHCQEDFSEIAASDFPLDPVVVHDLLLFLRSFQ